MSLKTIHDTISIDPTQLTTNIFSYIKNIVNKKNKLTCHKQYGYILDIQDENIKIIENEISPIDHNIIVKVKYTANTLLPRVGDIMDGVINVVLSCGVFFKVCDVIDVLVTRTSLESNQFVLKDNYIVKNKKKYAQGDHLKIKIVKSKYDHGKFIYIAELVI